MADFLPQQPLLLEWLVEISYVQDIKLFLLSVGSQQRRCTRVRVVLSQLLQPQLAKYTNPIKIQ